MLSDSISQAVGSPGYYFPVCDNPRPGQVAVVIQVNDVSHAPFIIFYEWAPAFGFTNGIINLTLAANRTWVGPDGTAMNDQVVVAYLRGNIQAAIGLRKAIDDALLLAAPTTEGTGWRRSPGRTRRSSRVPARGACPETAA